MDHPRGGPDVADASALAHQLEAVLRRQTGDRLGPVQWFSSLRQHGGAATGFSTFARDHGEPIPVLVKFPVGPLEHRWTLALGHAAPGEGEGDCTLPCPRVVAAGLQLGGYDLAWLIVERLSSFPTPQSIADHAEGERVVQELIRCCARFQKAAADHARPEGTPEPHNWESLLAKARHVAHDRGIAEAQRWNDAVRKVQKHLPMLKARWDSRAINAWCHGDFHPGNAMRRSSDPQGRCVLIDFALVHPGHWVEDALYLERLYWGHSEMLHGIKPVTALAQARRELGLSANDQYPELANVRRVLMAACAPAFAEHEGNAKYLHAALETIERILPQTLR